MESEKVKNPWFILAALIVIVAFVFFVPVQNCKVCAGSGKVKEFPAGLPIHPCGECGNDGRLTVSELLFD